MHLSSYSTLYLVVATSGGELVASRICDDLGNLRKALGEMLIEFPNCSIEVGQAKTIRRRQIAYDRYYDSEAAGELSTGLFEDC